MSRLPALLTRAAAAVGHRPSHPGWQVRLRPAESRRQLESAFARSEPVGQPWYRARHSRPVAGRKPRGPGCGPRGHATRPGALALGLLLSLAGLLPAAPHARHAHHLPHHLLGLEEPGDERAHLADRDSRAPRDPRPPRTVDDLRVLALRRGHRVHDRLRT